MTSVLANAMWGGGSDLGRGDLYGVGYTGFELMGVYNWVMCEGGAGWGQQHKPTPHGSVVANESRGARSLVVGTYMGRVIPRLRGWGVPDKLQEGGGGFGGNLPCTCPFPCFFPSIAPPYPLKPPISIL